METINVRNNIIDWLVAHGGDDNGTKMADFGDGESYLLSEVQLCANQWFIGPAFAEFYNFLEPDSGLVQVGVLVEHNLKLTTEQHLAIDQFNLCETLQ